MNKLYLLLCLFCLPLAVSAQTSFTIIENGEEQTVEGVLMSADGIEYISTPLKHYQITNKNIALLGDINRDDNVDIYDVSLIINMVLSGSFDKIANIDDTNEILDIYDIQACINISLHLDEVKTFIESYEVTDVTDIWIIEKDNDQPVIQN